MESSKEGKAPVFLERASRSTRGRRMTKLLDEEIEDDELFWNQDALKEEEIDDNYEEEKEIADEFDSDFNEDEPDPEEDLEKDTLKDADERTKKKLVFPGKPLEKNKKKRKVHKIEDTSRAEASTQKPMMADDGESERIVRKSTRTSVIVKQAERDAIRAALQATMKPIKRRKEGEERRMTQEEMLLEAAQTEIMNLRNLELVLAREEEVKKRAVVHKADEYDGPRIRYCSKNGCSYLEFIGLSFQSQISTASMPYPEKSFCAITGLPAKYRDPKTGLPFATTEAFKIIRQRIAVLWVQSYLSSFLSSLPYFVGEGVFWSFTTIYHVEKPRMENEKTGGRKEMDMGALFWALCGKGFLQRKNRLPISNRRRRMP